MTENDAISILSGPSKTIYLQQIDTRYDLSEEQLLAKLIEIEIRRYNVRRGKHIS